MSPNEIRAVLNQSHRELVAVERHNPDGWSFFLGQPRSGIKSNRILRATRSGPGAVTQLKLAVSSRHNWKEKKLRFSGDAAALRVLVDSELQLYREHFAERGGQ